MTDSLKFTVVIPTYNRADFIRTAIDSVLNQSYDNFQIIVVDDGSTDDTKGVMASITDPRVQYQYKDNEERAAARNRGATLSQGEYINFFDSDDVLYPNHLEVAKSFIIQNGNPEIFHLGYDIRNGEGQLIKEVNDFAGDINRKLIRGNFLSCNGVFLRRDIALAYPFNEDRFLSASEDFELWLRLASRYPIKFDNTITSTVIDHDMRSVISIKKDSLIKRIDRLIYHLQRDEAFAQMYGAQLRRFRSELYTYISLHLALTKSHRREVLYYLLKSLAQFPPIFFTRRFLASIKNLI